MTNNTAAFLITIIFILAILVELTKSITLDILTQDGKSRTATTIAVMYKLTAKIKAELKKPLSQAFKTK